MPAVKKVGAMMVLARLCLTLVFRLGLFTNDEGGNLHQECGRVIRAFR